MKLKVLIAIVLITSSTITGLLLYLCLRLCKNRRRRRSTFSSITPFPAIRSEEIELIPVQPQPHEWSPGRSPDLPPGPQRPEENTVVPLTPKPPMPNRPQRHVISKEELEIARRFAEGKVAELTMGILYRNGVLEITIRKIEKIHDSINKQVAYVRVKNPRERRISIPMLKYSKQCRALLGSHCFSFSAPPDLLSSMVFRFYLWSVDTHSRQREFGEFPLDFSKFTTEGSDLTRGITEKCDFLVYDPLPQEGDPAIRIKLKFHSKTAKMIITILEIRDLQSSSWAIFPAGIYIKVLFTNTSSGKKSNYKTKPVKGSNPRFHTTFNHPVLITELDGISMQVFVKAKTVKTETLCVLEFGSGATGRLGEHWTQMIQGISGGYGVEMDHRVSNERPRRMINPLLRRISNTALY